LLQADSFNAFQNAWLITRKFSAGREMAMSHTALIFIVLFMLQSLLPPTGKVEATASPSAREAGENQMVSDAEKDTTDKKPGPATAPDMVNTPAGPVPKNQVREVKPGEAVRRNKDGTFTNVPDPNQTGQ
jgi:hypothetical protein